MPYSSLYQNPHIALRNRRWSQGLAAALSVATLILLGAGALVTGTGSSLAVPDWPLAYGQFFPPMVGGILYEHGHRLIAASVGFLTILVGGWLWWAEDRRWVKVLGFLAIGLVIFQGLLGGITVLFLIPKAISISHALVGQLFFLLCLVLWQVTSPGWDKIRGRRTSAGRARLWGRVTLAVVLVEVLLGATVRHFTAGLAIPDFPLAYGGLVPPLGSFPIAIHFAHRIGALAVLIAVGGALWDTTRRNREEAALFPVAVAMAVLVAVQISLGAWAIWSRLSVPVTTVHLVTGALVFGATGIFWLRAELLASAPAKTG